MENENAFISSARSDVSLKYKTCMICYDNIFFTEYMVKKYISELKLGCAPGPDGITSEHLKFSVATNLITHLGRLFTVCFQHGVVPKSFNSGFLVPVLKKIHLGPNCP